MKRILELGICLLFGLGISSLLQGLFNFDVVSNLQTNFFHILANVLLGIGLYGSVYGLNKEDFHKNRQLIITLVTVGVFFKIVIISSIFWAISNSWLAFAMALAVAQIDPISVASVLNKKNSISKKIKSILSAWSSFDDPITVILSLVFIEFHTNDNAFDLSLIISDLKIFSDIIFNLGLIILVYFVNKKLKLEIHKLLVFFLIFLLSVTFDLLFALTFIGLILRPNFKGILEPSINISYYFSAVIVGFYLIGGVDFYNGFILAILAVLSQIVVSQIITRKFNRKEKLYLSFAQQNGITAILIILLMDTNNIHIAHVVIPAIIFINIIYELSNYVIRKT